MPGRVKMFGRMLALRRVATTDVAARQAEPKMHPLASSRQTLFTAIRIGFYRLDLTQVRTRLLRHGRTSFCGSKFSHLLQILMDELNGHGAFAYCGSHALG